MKNFLSSGPESPSSFSNRLMSRIPRSTRFADLWQIVEKDADDESKAIFLRRWTKPISMWWFRLWLFSGDGRPPGGPRGRSQGRRLLCRGPRWHHDHLQEEGGSLAWCLAWCLTWCSVDVMIGMMTDRYWRGWTTILNLKLDFMKKSINTNQSNVGSPIKYILWSSLHDRPVLD